jgi:hypothetical protein
MILLPKFPIEEDPNILIEQEIFDRLFDNDKPREEPEELGLDSWPYVEE